MSIFLNANLTGDLSEIPGVGPATIEVLKTCTVTVGPAGGAQVTFQGITSSFALIGVFLAFKNGEVDEAGNIREVLPIEHVQRFFLWWCSLGVSPGHRAGVVHSIGEKANISFPGIYDSAAYGASL